MSQTEIDGVVTEFRETVCGISDEEAEQVIELCRRKIKSTDQSDGYMELLLPDEMKNYVFRRAVNAVTAIRKMERE